VKELEQSKEDGRVVTIRAIGAGAVNQAAKAITRARGMVASTMGVDLAFRTFFETVMVEGQEKSAVNFILFDASRN
jgi:stage V sporulation protein S